MESQKTSMVFNCLIKKDGALYVGHCLELDIVAAGDTLDGVKRDLNDLIRAQVDFAFSNNNLDYLYHPAPAEVWEEFYRCKCAKEQKIKLSAPSGKGPHAFIPPWIIAKMCLSGKSCRV
jgi:hypothetical protein